MMTTWIVKTNNFKLSFLNADTFFCPKKIVFFISLKKLLFFWCLALLSGFIPGLNIFLVPLFLLIGVSSFFTHYKNTYLIKSGVYECPHCNNQIKIENVYLYENKKIECEVCMEQLVLEKAFTAAPSCY